MNPFSGSSGSSWTLESRAGQAFGQTRHLEKGSPRANRLTGRDRVCRSQASKARFGVIYA